MVCAGVLTFLRIAGGNYGRRGPAGYVEGQERKVTMELQIVYLPPGDLTPYEKNARKHAPDDIEAIKKSILEDGFNDPIGIWGEDNVIVEGHGRQIAATELGLDEVPCIRLDHMTDKQRREYMIRHNRVAELSRFDWDILQEECARLSIEGQDFEELKFDFGNEIDFPENLDAEETEEHKIHVKLTFPDYQSFVPYEEELKDLAERIGAEYGLMKS
jgi:hypothetical protein